MSNLRLRNTITLLVLAVGVSSCQHWVVQNAEPVQLVETSDPDPIRLTRIDSSTVTLHHPQVVGDSIVGTNDGARLAVAATEIRRVAVRGSNDTGTLILVGSAAALLILTFVGLHDCCGYLGY
jgi:hypothetical protein